MSDVRLEKEGQEIEKESMVDEYPWEYVIVFSVLDQNEKTMGFRHVVFLDKQPSVKETVDLFNDVMYNPRHINKTTKDDDRQNWYYNVLKRNEKTEEFLRSLDINPV